MLQTLDWPDIVLAVAAALAVLVIYDVVYVWPIHRRISALTERCSLLERSLGTALSELTARVATNDERRRDDLSRLGERLGQL